MAIFWIDGQAGAMKSWTESSAAIKFVCLYNVSAYGLFAKRRRKGLRLFARHRKIVVIPCAAVTPDRFAKRISMLVSAGDFVLTPLEVCLWRRFDKKRLNILFESRMRVYCETESASFWWRGLNIDLGRCG